MEINEVIEHIKGIILKCNKDDAEKIKAHLQSLKDATAFIEKDPNMGQGNPSDFDNALGRLKSLGNGDSDNDTGKCSWGIIISVTIIFVSLAIPVILDGLDIKFHIGKSGYVNLYLIWFLSLIYMIFELKKIYISWKYLQERKNECQKELFRRRLKIFDKYILK